MKKIITISILCFFTVHLAFCQETGHFQFGALGGVQSPLMLSKHYGNEKMKVGGRGAYNFHLSYLFPLKKFNAEARLSWGETMFMVNVGFSETAYNNHPTLFPYGNHPINLSSFDTPYYEMAFFLGKPFKVTRVKTSPWDARLGIGVRKRSTYYTYGFAGFPDSADVKRPKSVELPLYYRRFVPVISTGVTRMITFKYDFTLSIGAEASFCLINSAKGNYFLFPGQADESGGVMKLNGGYIGVRLGFGIPTHWKKKEVETSGQISMGEKNIIHLIPWYNSWFSGVTSFVVFPAEKTSSDPLRISFLTSPGISLTVGRRFKINHHLAISPRIGFSAQSYSYLVKEDSLHLPGLFSTEIYFDRTETFNRRSLTGELLFETPFIERKWFRLVGDVGAGMRSYVGKINSRRNDFDTIKNGFEITEEIHNKITPFFTTGIHGEWPGRLGNLQLGAEFSYCPNYPLTGTYTYFTGTAIQQSGAYRISGTMIGLRLTYLFRMKPVPDLEDKNK